MEILSGEQRLIHIQKTVNSLGVIQTYFDIKNKVNLSQGKHVLKLVFDKFNGGFNINKMVFTEAITTNIEDTELINLISMYPNPANTVLNVKLRNIDSVENIQLINALGEIVLSQKAENGFLMFDLQGFSSGGYVLKIEDNVHKVIIIK